MKDGESKVDQVLSVIDRALGPQPTEGPSPFMPSRYCWRCIKHLATAPGMLCGLCRSWMQGESDYDPNVEE